MSFIVSIHPYDGHVYKNFFFLIMCTHMYVYEGLQQPELGPLELEELQVFMNLM